MQHLACGHLPHQPAAPPLALVRSRKLQLSTLSTGSWLPIIAAEPQITHPSCSVPVTPKLDFLDSVPTKGTPVAHNSSSALVIRMVCGWPDGGLVVILWGSKLLSLVLSWSSGEESFYTLQTPRPEPSTTVTPAQHS